MTIHNLCYENKKYKEAYMDYYCKCKNCKYIDPSERDGYKWYCEIYNRYEDPDEVQECRDYRER